MTAWRRLARWHLSGADLVNQKNNVEVVLSRKKRDETEEKSDKTEQQQQEVVGKVDLKDDFDSLEIELEQKPEIDYRVLHTKVGSLKELVNSI